MKEFTAKESSLIKYVEQLDEEKVIELANDLLSTGMEPLYLLELVKEGMYCVGRMYESQDYYIADLIMAGFIFRQILQLDEMSAYFHVKHSNKIGKVVLGTVKGDIHDIGKDIVRGMLEVNGFEVMDLGVDVPKEIFLKKAQEYRPDIIGLSGVLTNSVNAMKNVITAFIQAGMRDNIKFIVGGNFLTESMREYVGADSFANDALIGVKTCKQWVNCSKEQGVTADDQSDLS